MATEESTGPESEKTTPVSGLLVVALSLPPASSGLKFVVPLPPQAAMTTAEPHTKLLRRIHEDYHVGRTMPRVSGSVHTHVAVQSARTSGTERPPASPFH